VTSAIALAEIPFGRPWITDEERAAALAVLRGDQLAHGPQCRAFEGEFAAFLGGGAHAVSVSSCMAALHMACLHFGLGPGDEVLVPAQTHTATVHAVELVGAKPVFVDCDARSGNVTPAGLAAALTPRTRAIVLVHFLGVPCDMPQVMALARLRGLVVIEDCALALGSRIGGTHVGLFGDAGCFSFYPVKHMTTGEGGMFVTRHAHVADAVGRLRAFGVERSGGYDVPALGLNYRMSEMAAAIGRVQLRRLEESLRRRRRNFEALAARLRGIAGLSLLEAAGPGQCSHYCLEAVLEGARARRRNPLLARLGAAGVGTSVYYPQPVPRLSFYRRKYGYDAARFPQAERISDGGVALPTGWYLQPQDIDHIAGALRRALEELDA
jgi:dTDP-4-amino-4,6-dideoxygalactose transaminase